MRTHSHPIRIDLNCARRGVRRSLTPTLRGVTPRTLRQAVATRMAETSGGEAAARHLGRASVEVAARHYIQRRP
ncbi:hypothetical protein FH969_12695 [Miniimonas arenae]|uniref:Uncharacterized protein n=1 Tax=Miniimonas arenae TaxID=676201 RepID=A0A5C5BAG4_9MICO|nr:hypothetical protein [Miniimonas sp. S16]TNU73177.1 hypothetical protein FH969_12695 [Miniimonas arenae]